MKTLTLMLVATLGLAACTTQTVPLVGQHQPGICQAPAYQNLVGKPLASFDRSKATGTVRVLGPRTAMTMDLNPSRMNVHHNARNIITKVECS